MSKSVNAAPAAPAARQISTWTTTLYGFGTVAYGVKDAGFGTFLLIFYNQVVGLDASSVSLVIFLALLFDAFVDPAIGLLSDRTQSRWGRRHPWMYAAALPIAIGWVLLWNPPAMGHGATLVWLFVTAVTVRSAVSCYEVPSQALTPELTADYDERTRITSYRYLFGWIGGLTILLLAYGVFIPGGALDRRGYGHLGIASAAIMAFAIIVSALGTHHEIERLPKVKVEQRSFADGFRELLETTRNRGFLILMGAGVCAYTVQGVGYALANYNYKYVWQLPDDKFRLLPLVLLVGAAAAFVIAPIVGRRTTKPRAAMVFVLLSALFQTAPYWLRLAGLMPPPGSEAVAWPFFAFLMTGTAFGVASFILGASMVADVVEDSEVRTGRRSEGVYFAGSFFVQKCTSGLGILIVGQVIDLIGFPKAAKPGLVPEIMLDQLTITYAALHIGLATIAALLFVRFPFGRSEHQARLDRMLAAAEREGAPHQPTAS